MHTNMQDTLGILNLYILNSKKIKWEHWCLLNLWNWKELNICSSTYFSISLIFPRGWIVWSISCKCSLVTFIYELWFLWKVSNKVNWQFYLPKAEYYKICEVRRKTDAWSAEQFCLNVGEKKNCQSYRVLRTRLYCVQFRHCAMKTTKGLSRGKIESVFGHFTKFISRKTDTSRNSLAEKRTLHEIH